VLAQAFSLELAQRCELRLVRLTNALRHRRHLRPSSHRRCRNRPPH
jgi:hypothetical protein